MHSSALPVLLLHERAPAVLRARSEASLARQSIETSVCLTMAEFAAHSHEYVALLVAGTELDATACERAVWFLHTHPSVAFVSGVAKTPVAEAPELSCVQQFLVTRREVVTALLQSTDALAPALAIAVAIGIRAQSGRGAGWITEPVIVQHTDAPVLKTLDATTRAALVQLQLEPSALIVPDCNPPMGLPLQSLRHVDPPPLAVRRSAQQDRRLLVLLQGFPMGGYTAFNADLLPRLVAQGYAVTTCTTEFWRTDWRLDLVRAVAPDIHHAHAVVPPASIASYIDWLIRSRGIDVVLLSHTFLGLHLLPWLRARHPSVAFVDYVHTDWFEVGMYGSYATMAARWTSQLDAHLATSNALASQLVDGGCDADGVRAAHIGIDTAVWRHNGPRLADVRQSFGASAETLVLLFAGRVSPEKRPHLAIDVAADLLAEGRDVVLVMAGGGPLLRAMRDHATQRGLGNRFHLLGELDEHVLRHVYASADIFIAPSEIEGIARVLYEAMALGCVPVVSDVGGQRELVVPGTGTLVDASKNDAAPYLDGVRPYFDRATRVTASAAARAHIATHFDSARTVQIVDETLTLARTRRPARPTTVPEPMAEELAVLALDIIRRHVLRAAGRG